MTISQEKKAEPLNLESVTWGDLTWVNIEQPTRRETEYLAKNYSFHLYDLDDCLSRKQRPKIDEYQDYLFMVLHFPRYHKEEGKSTPSQVSVFVGEKYVITLHQGELKPLVKLFRQCQIDADVRQEHLSQGSGYLLYRIIDRLIDYLFPILDKILESVDNIEDSVFDEKIEVAEDLAVLRRDIITQRRIIWPMRAVIGSLEPKLKRFSKVDLNVYFGDTVDHVDKVWDTLDECKEVIEVFKDSDYTLSAERLNHIMRVLTIISTMMLPLIVISSLWSMNVPLPFGANPGGSPYVFVAMVIVLLSVVGGMLYFFHRKRWI